MSALIKNEETQNAVSKTEAAPQRVLTPRANVVENKDAFVVQIEMPGVTQEGLEITLEQNVLNIQGKAVSTGKDGYKQVYREYLAGDYQRRFVLSDGVDQDGLEASFANGVLELKLPKVAEAVPRKIPVNGA